MQLMLKQAPPNPPLQVVPCHMPRYSHWHHEFLVGGSDVNRLSKSGTAPPGVSSITDTPSSTLPMTVRNTGLSRQLLMAATCRQQQHPHLLTTFLCGTSCAPLGKVWDLP